MDTRALLTEAEIRAERTTAYARLAMGITGGVGFGIEIGFLPGGSAVSQALTPALPYMFSSLVGFFIIAVLSLVLARPRFFRPWMPWVFTAFDIAFWLLLICAAVFLLRLPTRYLTLFPPMWVAPIILGFVALRHNPWLQAFAITMMIAGLAIIHGVAPPRETVVPADFAFMLLAPPNGARLSMIVFTSLVLIVVAISARSLLRRAISEQVRRANLTRYLPPQLADQLATTGDEVLRGRQQQAAILFIDIRGFTTMAETMPPVALSEFLSTFRKLVTNAADNNSGVVDKFIGDGALVVFGMPEARIDDACNALACAEDLQRMVVDWNAKREPEAPIQIGIGVHYGPVFMGAVGDESRLEFTVLGDNVNVAARLEEATKEVEEQIIASATVLDAANLDEIMRQTWQQLPAREIRGRHGDIELFAK